MGELVQNAVESFGTRVSAQGPEVFLNPGAAQGFALVLHELATNAAKHGSLSTESGTIDVTWSVDATTADPTIHFQWQEKGGPVVAPPNRKGFGTVLLERAVPSVALPRFNYAPGGFSYEVKAVLAEQQATE